MARLITAERLREIVHYDPATGAFVWLDHSQLSPARRARYVGKAAGAKTLNGYWSIGLEGRSYAAHRIAWLYMTGSWPKNQIDHVNCDRGDNRLSNLREATNAENAKNAKISKNNTSGFKGVCWDKRNKKFIASIGVDGKLLYLGRFRDVHIAAQAYRDAAEKHHGEFARVHG